MNKSAINSRIYSLDGIRAIAALLVFFLHVQYFNLVWNEPIAPNSIILTIFFNLGHFAVDAFFIISTYLVTTMWLGRVATRQAGSASYLSFIKARFMRIAPAYYVSVTVVAAVVFLYDVWEPADLLEEWLLHISFLGGVFGTSGFSINPVYWSLSVEMILYATIPLCVLIAQGLGIRGLVISALAASLAWRYLVPTLGLSHWLPHAFPGQLFEISLGVAMARQKISFPQLAVAPATALLIYIAWIGPTGVSPVVYMAVALLMMILVSAAIESARFASFSKLKPVRWMADVSYSFYLWHAVVLYGLTIVIKDPIVLIVTGLSMSLLVAYLSRRFIEKAFH